MIKGVLRVCYCKWASGLVMEHLKDWHESKDFILQTGWTETKQQMALWMCKAVASVQANKQEKLKEVWWKTDLSRAWEEGVKKEALHKAGKLFKGAHRADEW
eukprot:1515804-Rhodomonas_salina.2